MYNIELSILSIPDLICLKIYFSSKSRPIIRWSRLENVAKSLEYNFKVYSLSIFILGDGLGETCFPFAEAIFLTDFTVFMDSTVFLVLGIF